MKSTNNIKAVLTTTLVLSFILVSLVSCDWIISKKDKSKIGVNQTRININKDEAKLLVLASQSNLDVIKLCQFIKDTETKNDIKYLANELKKTHVKIFNDYKELAQEKLISIPHHSNIDTEIVNNTLNKNINGEFIEENLELITEKINKQIELLNKLSETTNNKEFRDLSKKANSILKSKLVKTEDILNKLKTNKIS
tara:strand:- start:11849 stop:12439 length:591 start_codon:yes stop_codon:yes gene_type:complete